MKQILLTGVALGALIATAVAQTATSPANMGITPTTTPEVLQVLDNTSTWVPIGSVNPTTHTFGVFGAEDVDVTQYPYYADPLGVLDSTAALNAAFAQQNNSSSPTAAPGKCLYLPTGNYFVTNAIVASTFNGCIHGDGRTRSVIWAYADGSHTAFNLSALGVLVLPTNGGGTGAIIKDIGFDFSQPNTAGITRAQIVAFPPAIYAEGAARTIIERVRISDANACIDASQNAGGVRFHDIECGALTTGLLRNGSQDSSYITDFHFWPFGSQIGGSNPLNTVFKDGQTQCMNIGQDQHLSINGFACFIGNLVITAAANTGGEPMYFENGNIDGGAFLSVAGGSVYFPDLSVQGGNATYPVVSVTGGAVKVSNYRVGITDTVPEIQVTGGTLMLGNGEVSCGGTTTSCATVSNGTLQIANSRVNPSTLLTAGVPFVAQLGGSLRFYDDYFLNLGSAGQVGVSYANDNNLNYLGRNAMTGWGVAYPPSRSTSYSAYDNTQAAAPALSGTCAATLGGSSNSADGVTGRITVGSASCSARTLVLTFAQAARNHWSCQEFQDLTTPSNSFSRTTDTTTSITFTGNAAPNDTLEFSCKLF